MGEERLVMGYWDCPYCNAKGIQGTVRECPGCSKPRGNDVAFYMKSKSHDQVVAGNEYLSDEQSKTKGQGADWQCSYCGGLNSNLTTACTSCGHIRDEQDSDYFAMKEKDEAKAAWRQKMVEAGSPKQTVPATPFYKAIWFKILIIVAVIAAIIGFVNMPRTADFHVTDKAWEYSTEIEEYKYVDEDDWSLPEGADLQRTENEIHHYDHVFDHYETRERTYQEREQVGSHTEYTYKDNGDGTFTEVPHSVPDYEYVSKTETYREPIYRDDPVWKTKYYYKIWRWKYKTTIVNAGDADDDPAYPKPELGENEREGSKHEAYTVTGYLNGDDGHSQIVEVDRQMYFDTNIEDDLKANVTITGEVTEFAESD